MPNPFTVVGRGMNDRRPLSPLDHAEHEHLYVPVDHTQEAFEAIVNTLRQVCEGTNPTRLILVSGAEGTGKTSLIYRVVHWLSTYLESLGVASHHIDLTEEGSFGLGSEARVQHLVSRLIDKVGFLNVLSEPEIAKLENKRNEPQSALPYLAELTAAKAKRLIIVLPRLEIQEELFRIVDYSRPPLVVLTETAEESLARVATSKYASTPASSVCVATLGNLQIEDGWRFVNARLHGHEDSAKADETVVARFMATRIKGRGGTSILELLRTCQIVWANAEESGAALVEYSDFQDSYILKGILP